MANANDQFPDGDRGKACRYFDYAKHVATTGGYGLAIEMFLSGLALVPNNVEEHKALRQLSLERKAAGGKDMGIFDKRKYATNTRDHARNMLNAERLLAYDPGNVAHMQVFAEWAIRCEFEETAIWITRMYFKAIEASQ
jgi:hypothetical protein